MAELGWAVLCNRMIVDEETKLVSMMDVVDTLNIAPRIGEKDVLSILLEARKDGDRVAFPFRPYLVTWWYRSDWAVAESGAMDLLLVGPSGEPLQDWGPLDVNLENTPAFRLAARFEEVTLNEPGLHFLVVRRRFLNSVDVVARVPLEVRIRARDGST